MYAPVRAPCPSSRRISQPDTLSDVETTKGCESSLLRLYQSGESVGEAAVAQECAYGGLVAAEAHEEFHGILGTAGLKDVLLE